MSADAALPQTMPGGSTNSEVNPSLRTMASTRLSVTSLSGLWQGGDALRIFQNHWVQRLTAEYSIIPWNGPLASVGLKAAPALAMGNTFILKPSEKTPLMAAELGKLVLEAGFPPGVFQVLTGDGSTGALLASHMGVSKVSFTGSIPTGKTVQALAAKSNLKRVTLELGGKSPAVVFDDADMKNAIDWYAYVFFFFFPLCADRGPHSV